MLYFKDGQLNLCPHKVFYTQNGEEYEAYTNDKQWWENFAEQWDHTTINTFEDVVYSEAQVLRFEAIKHNPEGFADVCAMYVETGQFPSAPGHPLEPQEMKELLADLIELQLMGGIEA